MENFNKIGSVKNKSSLNNEFTETIDEKLKKLKKKNSGLAENNNVLASYFFPVLQYHQRAINHALGLLPGMNEAQAVTSVKRAENVSQSAAIMNDSDILSAETALIPSFAKHQPVRTPDVVHSAQATEPGRNVAILPDAQRLTNTPLTGKVRIEETTPARAAVSGDMRMAETTPARGTVSGDIRMAETAPARAAISGDIRMAETTPARGTVSGDIRMAEPAPARATVSGDTRMVETTPARGAVSGDIRMAEPAPARGAVSGDIRMAETTPARGAVSGDARMAEPAPARGTVSGDIRMAEPAPARGAVSGDIRMAETTPARADACADLRQPAAPSIAGQIGQGDPGMRSVYVPRQAQRPASDPVPETPQPEVKIAHSVQSISTASKKKSTHEVTGEHVLVTPQTIRHSETAPPEAVKIVQPHKAQVLAPEPEKVQETRLEYRFNTWGENHTVQVVENHGRFILKPSDNLVSSSLERHLADFPDAEIDNRYQRDNSRQGNERHRHTNNEDEEC